MTWPEKSILPCPGTYTPTTEMNTHLRPRCPYRQLIWSWGLLWDWLLKATSVSHSSYLREDNTESLQSIAPGNKVHRSEEQKTIFTLTLGRGTLRVWFRC